MMGKVMDCSQERIWRGGWPGKVEEERDGEGKWALGLSGCVTGFLTGKFQIKAGGRGWIIVGVK